jgi:hypothetical protein
MGGCSGSKDTGLRQFLSAASEFEAKVQAKSADEVPWQCLYQADLADSSPPICELTPSRWNKRHEPAEICRRAAEKTEVGAHICSMLGGHT